MKKYIMICCLFVIWQQNAQNDILNKITLSEYLGYVKNYHPIVKQANLIINSSEAKLLKKRGAFDPKIEVDFNEKILNQEILLDSFEKFEIVTEKKIEKIAFIELL